jgi:dienelactone hydrolase
MPSRPRSRAALVLTLALGATFAAPTTAQAASPVTAAAAASGHHHAPLAFTTTPVAPQKGFAGGTIYTPQGTGAKRLGAVVVTPGYKGTQRDVAWYGPALAQEGFVVLTIDTLDPLDFPAPRAAQILAATDYLTDASPARGVVDRSRLAVLGHSMGGGGSLRAAEQSHEYRAAIGLTPFDYNPKGRDGYLPMYPRMTTPTLVITAQKDEIAPAWERGRPSYDSIPTTTPKQYIELAGKDHFAPMSSEPTIRAAVVAFLKLHLDGNSAYAEFVCPAPPVGGPILVSESVCPA